MNNANLKNQQDINIKASIKILTKDSCNSKIINHFGCKIGISKETLEDFKTIRYISNIISENNYHVTITIDESNVWFKVIYPYHEMILTIPALNICEDYDIKLAGYITTILGITECEVISLFCYEDVELEDEEI